MEEPNMQDKQLCKEKNKEISFMRQQITVNRKVIQE